MDLQTIISEARRVVNEIDSSESHFTDSQMTIWANEGYRYILTRLESIPKSTRDYASAETFSINARTLLINKAKILAMPDSEWRELGIITVEQLYDLDADWENAETGIPEYLVRTGTFTARLYPAPDAANTGTTIRVHGMEFPADLAVSTDVPDLPLNLHDLIPHWIAYRAFQQLALVDRSSAELILCNSLLKSQHSISTKFSRERTRWVVGPQEDDC